MITLNTCIDIEHVSDLIGQFNQIQVDVELRYIAVMGFLYEKVSCRVFHIFMPEVLLVCSPTVCKMFQNLDLDYYIDDTFRIFCSDPLLDSILDFWWSFEHEQMEVSWNGGTPQSSIWCWYFPR